jgi:cytidine deaminase
MPQAPSLLERARIAASNAYCPYSGFPVGAAVETDCGIFVGANMENASFGLTVCAERVALWNAINAGAKEIKRLAVACVGAEPDAPDENRMPCGACRQVMAEFLPPTARIEIEGVGEMSLSELLPKPFQLGIPPYQKGAERA